MVSTFHVIDKSLTLTTCSTSDLIFIILSVKYKVINELYYESNFLRTSINQKVEETYMTATASQLDAVTTFHSKRAVSVHKINSIASKHKLRMKDSRDMREKQMNQLVSLKSEVKSEQKNTPKVVYAVVR